MEAVDDVGAICDDEKVAACGNQKLGDGGKLSERNRL